MLICFFNICNIHQYSVFVRVLRTEVLWPMMQEGTMISSTRPNSTMFSLQPELFPMRFGRTWTAQLHFPLELLELEWHGVFFRWSDWPHLPHSTGSWIEKVGSRRVWSLSLQKRLRKYAYRPCTCYMPLCSVPFRMVFQGIIGSHGEWSFYERVQSTKKEYQHTKKKSAGSRRGIQSRKASKRCTENVHFKVVTYEDEHNSEHCSAHVFDTCSLPRRIFLSAIRCSASLHVCITALLIAQPIQRSQEKTESLHRGIQGIQGIQALTALAKASQHSGVAQLRDWNIGHSLAAFHRSARKALTKVAESCCAVLFQQHHMMQIDANWCKWSITGTPHHHHVSRPGHSIKRLLLQYPLVNVVSSKEKESSFIMY